MDGRAGIRVRAAAPGVLQGLPATPEPGRLQYRRRGGECAARYDCRTRRITRRTGRAHRPLESTAGHARAGTSESDRGMKEKTKRFIATAGTQFDASCTEG